MSTETGLGARDMEPVAQLVDCTPEEPPPQKAALPDPPESTPVSASSDATIEQTGADPPPLRED